jgi:DNA-binding transcriptional MerR regulator
MNLLTTEQAAKLLNLTPATLRTWRSNKKVQIPYTKISNLVRYEYEDLVDFIARNKQLSSGHKEFLDQRLAKVLSL